jgi:hypothetical protein
MIHIKKLGMLLSLGLLAAACQPATPGVTPTAAATDTPIPQPTQTAIEPATATPDPSPTAAVTFTPEITETSPAATPERPEEAILLLEPGPGSRVTSPIRVSGVADPTFEQNLVVRIVSADGEELAQTPTTIQADVGQRGEFEVEIPLDLSEEANIFIQVYSTSARDGGTLHLASTGVTFTPTGPEDIVTRQPEPEQIAIFQPMPGETVSGGVAHVEGFGLASFEQNLVIEVQDAQGNVIGSQPVIVEAPDLGFPGSFSADVEYTLTEAGPGRIVVRDPSPAFGGDVHLSSVEIDLQP